MNSYRLEWALISDSKSSIAASACSRCFNKSFPVTRKTLLRLASIDFSCAPESSLSESGSMAVKAFLASPDRSTVAGLSGSNEAGCWAVIDSSNSNLGRLTHWVKQGSQSAAAYLAKHLKQLDGGNLEDALVALGDFSDHNMEEFLILARKGLLSGSELSDALTRISHQSRFEEVDLSSKRPLFRA